MKKLIGLTLSLALVLSISPLSALAYIDEDMAHLRAIHASPNAPTVDVLFDGDVAFPGVSFMGVSDYAEVPDGDHNIMVRPAGEDGPDVIDADVDLRDERQYTVIAIGELEDVEALVLRDDIREVDSDDSRVRFVHASPDAPRVDVYFDGDRKFNNLDFGEDQDRTVDAGEYDIEVRLDDGDDVVLELDDTEFDGGSAYTIVIVGYADGVPGLDVITTEDPSAGNEHPGDDEDDDGFDFPFDTSNPLEWLEWLDDMFGDHGFRLSWFSFLF